MEEKWSMEGQRFVESLDSAQKSLLMGFFKGSPDDALRRVQHWEFPNGLRRTTLQGYVIHVAEPAIKRGEDKAKYTLNGQQHEGIQKFRKRLIEEALHWLS